MLGSNYEKMALISPAAAKDWPQTQLSDDLKVSMSNNMDNNSSRNSAMVVMNQKLAQQDSHQQQQQQQHLLQQQQQQALKCPRCDSSNTKFCYYNNYSLTQPRHFCKACKRYWTRGGTLRNVPVGGGCRKNKRVKRPNINSSSNNNSSSSASLDAPPSSITPSTTPSTTIHHPLLGHHNLNPSSESYLNNNHQLFYGNSNPNSEMNLLYQSRFGGGNNPSSRVVVSGLENTVSGYDLIPGLGLGFSPGNNIIDVNANPSKEMEMHNIVNPSSNSFLSSCYSSLIGPGGGMFSAPSSCTTATTMSSLIASYGLQKFNSNGSSATDKSQQEGTRVGNGSGGANNQFQTFFPFEEMQISSSSHGFGSNEQNKDVKVEEEGQNRLGGGWKNDVGVPYQNHQMEQSDTTSYWNNNNNAAAAHSVSAWPDLANIGSSVTSLI